MFEIIPGFEHFDLVPPLLPTHSSEIYTIQVAAGHGIFNLLVTYLKLCPGCLIIAKPSQLKHLVIIKTQDPSLYSSVSTTEIL